MSANPAKDFVVIPISKERDPGGTLLRQALQSQFAISRARALRTALVHLLAILSALVWLDAIWPDKIPPAFRALSLLAWLAVFIGVLIGVVSEWRLRRRNARLADHGRPAQRGA